MRRLRASGSRLLPSLRAASGRGLLAFSLLAAASPGCHYRRLDRELRATVWMHKGDTVRLAKFANHTPNLGLEDRLTKALEYRIVAASPWKLVPVGQNARWVLQGTLERYETRAIGLSLGTGADKRSAGTASRVEVILVASVDLLDGQTGAVVLSRKELTFSSQYRVDQNFASFDNREVQVVSSLADDFAESFLTQLLEGSE